MPSHRGTRATRSSNSNPSASSTPYHRSHRMPFSPSGTQTPPRNHRRVSRPNATRHVPEDVEESLQRIQWLGGRKDFSKKAQITHFEFVTEVCSCPLSDYYPVVLMCAFGQSTLPDKLAGLSLSSATTVSIPSHPAGSRSRRSVPSDSNPTPPLFPTTTLPRPDFGFADFIAPTFIGVANETYTLSPSLVSFTDFQALAAKILSLSNDEPFEDCTAWTGLSNGEYLPTFSPVICRPLVKLGTYGGPDFERLVITPGSQQLGLSPPS